MGYGSYSSDGLNLRLANGTIVGNYCSIGPGVVSFNANHPDHFFTTHPILYNPKCGHVTSDQLDRITLEIGHDVWIGANSIILPKVKRIGNGAIIGAGAVITKDVPPYAVVAGNPGKILKYRFSESTIADLEKTKWWDSTMESLKKNTHCLNTIASPVHNLKTAIPQYSNFEKPANTIRHQGTMHLDEKIK
ncbi:MAG: CatB-related O-acetyltransferase [Fibrobacteria bacterium]|nr:CatB-related O-acetyltransferase [Fibrobacteria bacterium]